jgi:nucleoside 2-deoxyribosyltransferase
MEVDRKPAVYLAGPLFTQAERSWNRELADALAARGYRMLVPQVLSEQLITNTAEYDPRALFRLAANSVQEADVVLAILDGPDPDSGTAFECGIAWSKEIPVVGLRTDFRKGGDGRSNVNLMLSESSRSIVYADSLVFDNAAAVAAYVDSELRAALAR